MTVLHLAKNLLVLHLVTWALASPMSLRRPTLNISESEIVPRNPLESSLSHHAEKRNAVIVPKEINVNASMLSPIRDFLRLSLLLPAKKLQMLQMLTTKLVDISIGVPANLLEGVAELKVEDVKKSLMLKKIAKAGSFEKIKKLILGPKSITKTINQGPGGIKKNVEIVTPAKTVTVSISKGVEIKTPPPIDAPEITTPATVPEITTPPPVIPVVPVQPAVVSSVVVPPAPPVILEITTPAPEVLETTPAPEVLGSTPAPEVLEITPAPAVLETTQITTPPPVIPVVPDQPVVVSPVVVPPAPPVILEITTPAPEVLQTTPPAVIVKKDVEIDLPLKKP